MPRTAIIPSPFPAAGKTARDENFPVASLFFPAGTRRQIMAFYHFARMADDVADDPNLGAEQKLMLLDGLERALQGRPGVGQDTTQAESLRAAVDGDDILLGHAAQLLQAFRRDAVVDHCRDWADLMTYCRFSAAPVGRFLLELNGESAQAFPASDALCAALQVLNHVQDCADDCRTLGRVYIPRDWLLMAGLGNDSLTAPQSCPDLRLIIDQVLDHVDSLLDTARPLLSLINGRRLRCEAAATLAVAEKLSALLRVRDPLAGHVRLSPTQYFRAMLAGLRRGWRPKT